MKTTKNDSTAEWEKDFDLLWGPSRAGSYKYDKGNNIRWLFRNTLKAQHESDIQAFEEMLKDDYIEEPERPVNRQTNYVNMVRNNLRAELRQKLDKLK